MKNLVLRNFSKIIVVGCSIYLTAEALTGLFLLDPLNAEKVKEFWKLAGVDFAAFSILLGLYVGAEFYGRRSIRQLGPFTILIFVICFLVAALSLFAASYRTAGLIEPGGGITRNTRDCLYFSIVTWTTVGYGDLRPTSDIRMVAAAEAFTGYLSLAALVGLLNWILSETFGRRSNGEARPENDQPHSDD